MHALLVAAMLSTPEVKPITPLIIEKPDDITDLRPDRPITHREVMSLEQMKRFVETLNEK